MRRLDVDVPNEFRMHVKHSGGVGRNPMVGRILDSRYLIVI